MIKKYAVILIVILFTSNCGFTPVYLNKSIKETTTIIENLKANIDSSIEDEENRKTIKENVNNIFKNFENTLSSTKTKIYENLDYPNITSEEE